MKIQKLISGIVFMCAIVLLANENRTSLTGKVQDQSGFGIISGSLEVYENNPSHKLIYKTEVADNGVFTLSNLAPGQYQFIVKAQGFDDKIETVNIEADCPDLGVITMGQDENSLEEVVIYGESSKNYTLLDEVVIYGKAK